MKSIKTIRLFLLCICTFTTLTAFSQLPEKYIGNWINEESVEWEYGFFEKFAIYESDFWDYSLVETSKNGKTKIVISKNGVKVNLELTQIGENNIKVKKGKDKIVAYVKMQKEYPAYKTKDNSEFPYPAFKQDSATIIGYYRNLDKIPKQFRDRLNYAPIDVSVPNFISDEQDNYYTDIDSLGRFKIKIPIINTQGVFFDWRRTMINVIVSPDDKLFVFADMADYVSLDSDKSRHDYFTRQKQVLFMGDNARVNNELVRYKTPDIYFYYRDMKEGETDMDYLKDKVAIFDTLTDCLNNYLELYPTTSEKFRFYQTNGLKYSLASNLMQHRFHIRTGAEIKSFQSGYIEYVQQNFTFDNQQTYTLINNFKHYLRDYIGYYGDISGNTVLTLDMIIDRLKENGRDISDISAIISEYKNLVTKLEKVENEAEKQVIVDSLNIIGNKLAAAPIINETAMEMLNEQHINTKISDSLITNPVLNDLWTGHLYNQYLETNKKPLPENLDNTFKGKVKMPYVLDYIEQRNSYYRDINNKGFKYEASLKKTEHLKEFKEADALFQKLIEPYKGNVIYVDFWGTWCAPCRENLKFAGQVKDKLKGEKVIFMYFANNSLEDAWKGIIKEYDLTGENIVHYNLPNDQQSMIERKFSVRHFPTYMLIDQEGKVINTDAASPKRADEAVRQIKELLKKE